MNVVVVGFNFSLLGGLEIVSKAIAAALASHHSVTCLSLHEVGITREDQFNIVGIAKKSRILRSLQHRLPSRFAWRGIAGFLESADAAVFAHAHALRIALPFMDRLESRPASICWLHGREVWGENGSSCAPYLRRCDRLVAVSRYTAATVAAEISGTPPIEVIHNPVNIAAFSESVAQDEAIRRHHILTVGRHDADSTHKGYDKLIDALAILRARRPDLPLHLTIVGAGELLDAHREQVSRLGLLDHVSLAGKTSFAGLRSLYRTTDVFAFPSRVMPHGREVVGEGFGLVNIEAAAAGRPVLTSTHGGCPETIVDGVTGIAVDPNRAEAVADGLERLFDMTAAQRDAMGHRGRVAATERFSDGVFRKRVLETVDSVVSKKCE